MRNHRRKRWRSPVPGVIVFALGVLLLYPGSGSAQTPPGMLISNQASVSYTAASGMGEIALSNRVDLTTVAFRTSSSLSLTRVVASAGTFNETVGPAACLVAGSFGALPDPMPSPGQTLDPGVPQQLISASRFHGGEPVFLRLEDLDQNLDPTQPEWVVVSVTSPATADVEQIRLTETGPDTGVFAGYVPTAVVAPQPGDCLLQPLRNSDFEASYVDALDAADRSLARGRFDPVSRVFSSETGAAVSGSDVTLIDALTNQPAQVFGDDGLSPFPATVRSGGTVTDSGGVVYSFGPGEYRFPVVPAGRYRVVIGPPAEFAAPSIRSIPELQLLAGSPFELGPGSFGQPFDLYPGPVLAVDVPLDPTVGQLFLQKRTLALNAAPGDFLEYQLTLSHGPARQAQSVVITDQLPPGFRYLAGSTRIDGATASDPEISPDGRSLRFEPGALPPDATVSLRYVVAVTPGARPGEAVNVAQAVAGGRVSNVAQASVEIVDDLFRSEALLVGRVVLGACTDPRVGETAGLAGVRVYLEDGRFAVTDAGGRFHFEGLPGGAHVVQLDGESLPPGVEVQPCDEDIRFAGRADSQFVTLRPGGLGRADFHVRRAKPESTEIKLSLTQSVAAGRTRYELRLWTLDEILAEDLQLMVMLPEGVEYIDGSVRSTTGSVPDVRRHDGVLTFELGQVSGPWDKALSFAATLAPDASGQLVTRAIARFTVAGEPSRTPAAETEIFSSPGVSVAEEYVLQLNFATLSAALDGEDRDLLDSLAADWRGVENIQLEAIGHSDYVPIAARNWHLFPDNYVLSEERAASVARYLGDALGLAADRWSYQGLGPDRPIADNRTAEGRRENRRVELRLTGLREDRDAELELVRSSSGEQAVRLEGEVLALPGMTRSVVPEETHVAAAASQAPRFEIQGLEPGVDWLWPTLGHAPPIPSVHVVIQHAPSQQVQLELNGHAVSPLNFEGRETNTDETVALSRWRGLDLIDGPNELRARILRDGLTENVLERTLHFAGPPVRGELVEEASHLVADGRIRPALAIRFVDRWGEHARLGTVGGFSVAAPYRAWWEVERLRENPLLATGDQSPTYKVGRDGLAFIELEPTTQTGQVQVQLVYPEDRVQELRSWLRPEARDWILVGIAEGSVGYNTVKGEMELIQAAGYEDEYFDQGRLAFFAKGRIRGSTLLTIAFDTHGDRDERDGRFGGVIDPDRYYTLYGDTTEQRFDAPSRERLYIKIEREAFVALFGDFDTGLTVTELGRYSRTFTGLKSEYHGERFQYAAFASQTDQAFVKDELRGDGTSGPYRLTRRPILLNSDKIVVEVRDRFRPERILVSRSLQRHFDYDIDYTTGTVYFKEPVASRDFDFNPVYVVADYESLDDRENALIAGGRAAVKMADERAELGVTLLYEGIEGAEGALTGTDFRYRFNDATELRAEFAVSQANDPAGGEARGDAYLVELTHQRGQVNAQAYVREQEAAFGLGQQRGNEAGTRRGGVDVRAQLNSLWLVNGSAFRQEMLDQAATRTVIEGESTYQDTVRTASLGLRHVDEDLNGEARDSTQAFVGGTWRFMDEFLTARINLEKALSGNDDITDYPTRTVMGLDVAIKDRITVFGEYELTDGRDLESQMARVGVRANPTDRMQIDSTVNQVMTEYGPRTFASLGLIQGWQLGEHWTLDAGAEHSNTLREPTLTPFDPDVPLASGSLGEDFSVGFFGLGYHTELWTFTSRFEYRNSDREERAGFTSGFYRERVAGKAFSAELRLLDTVAAGISSFDGALRLGWAHRPADSRWVLFDRVDWINQSQTDVTSQRVRSQRFVNNLNAHFLVSPRQELELQYAAKYVRSNFGAVTAKGYIDLLGFGWRHDLGRRLDVGVHGSWYRAPELGVIERGWGIDFGVHVADNLLLRVGYNFAGFEDEDFSRNRYTAEGPYINFSLKVDQASLRDLLRR